MHEHRRGYGKLLRLVASALAALTLLVPQAQASDNPTVDQIAAVHAGNTEKVQGLIAALVAAGSEVRRRASTPNATWAGR